MLGGGVLDRFPERDEGGSLHFPSHPQEWAYEVRRKAREASWMQPCEKRVQSRLRLISTEGSRNPGGDRFGLLMGLEEGLYCGFVRPFSSSPQRVAPLGVISHNLGQHV